MSPWDFSASPCPVQLCSRLLSFTLLACFGFFAVGSRNIAEPPDVWKIRATGFVARAWEGGKCSDRQRYQAPGSAAGPQPFCLPHQRKGFAPLLIKLRPPEGHSEKAACSILKCQNKIPDFLGKVNRKSNEGIDKRQKSLVLVELFQPEFSGKHTLFGGAWGNGNNTKSNVEGKIDRASNHLGHLNKSLPFFETEFLYLEN